VLEKGMLPREQVLKMLVLPGSISEIIDDLNSHSEEEVIQLIEKTLARVTIKGKSRRSCSRFKPFGGYEVLNEEDSLYSNCINRIPFINEMLHPSLKQTFFC
jgi:hypothetical protein